MPILGQPAVSAARRATVSTARMGIKGQPLSRTAGAAASNAARNAKRQAMSAHRLSGISAAKTRSAQITSARRAKMTSRAILGASGIGIAANMYRNRTGPAADKPRGRPTGPYMY